MKDEAEEDEDKNDSEEEDEKIDQINDGNKNSLLVDLSAGGIFLLIYLYQVQFSFQKSRLRCQLRKLSEDDALFFFDKWPQTKCKVTFDTTF